MKRKRLTTVLVGFGRIAQQYAHDRKTARHFRYATHAQVLADHPRFDWQGVVDVARFARTMAQRAWQVPDVAASVQRLPHPEQYEVAVLATPADQRLGILDHLPRLRAVIVEKPLGTSFAKAERFVHYCDQNNIAVQVNYWRRADAFYRRLAAGRLTQLIGSVQGVQGVYGHGLYTNGSHLIDFFRWQIGEVAQAGVVSGAETTGQRAWPKDINIPFSLVTRAGIVGLFMPLDFSAWRENAVTIWGKQAVLQIDHEGLRHVLFPRRPHRALTGAFECDFDHGRLLPVTAGHALYTLYSDLAASLASDQGKLVSPGSSALITERVVARLKDSQRAGGAAVTL